MSTLTLEHIEQAVAKNPHPQLHGDIYSDADAMAQLTKVLKREYPDVDLWVSLWGCVVLGFGLEPLDASKKPASNNVLNSLRTEDAECSHNSTGIRMGDRFLCEFGIVDEKQWGQSCKQHLVEFIAKDNLRGYMQKPQIDLLAILCSSDFVSNAWTNQVLASIQANIIAEATPTITHSSTGPRL